MDNEISTSSNNKEALLKGCTSPSEDHHGKSNRSTTTTIPLQPLELDRSDLMLSHSRRRRKQPRSAVCCRSSCSGGSATSSCPCCCGASFSGRRRRSRIPLVLRPMLVVVAVLHLVFLCQPVASAFMYQQSWDTSSNSQIFSIVSASETATATSDDYYHRSARTAKRSITITNGSSKQESGRVDRFCLYAKLSDSSDEDDDDGRNSTDEDSNGNEEVGSDSSNSNIQKVPSQTELALLQRVTQLEQLVAAQQVQIRHLTKQVQGLTENMVAFDQVIELLREAGQTVQGEQQQQQSSSQNSDKGTQSPNPSSSSSGHNKKPKETPTVTEPSETDGIFSSAPSSVMDAADAAGAAILAGLLAGKQRMLVDVRDAELSFEPENSETLVQFLELAILPVAAGLEGLRSQRNRLKIVFPTVSQLLIYRKTMALAAPEVVALSTLGFDPVENKDNLVVIVVPAPDDEEGLTAMNELLLGNSLTQPVVVINHHMVPVSGPAAEFDVAYHLRLLSVQFMTGDNPEQYLENPQTSGSNKDTTLKVHNKSKTADDDADMSLFLDEDTTINTTSTTALYSEPMGSPLSFENDLDSDDEKNVGAQSSKSLNETRTTNSSSSSSAESAEASFAQEKYEALEAAMKHAHEVGINRGVTRAMVIRAYPQPWHVFVDTSPDTDADFEVAALFDEEPTIDEVNLAIIECLEGSEREDELVAQQMQQALELGQLDRISEMLSEMGMEDLDDGDDYDDDEDDPYRDMFGEDTV